MCQYSHEWNFKAGEHVCVKIYQPNGQSVDMAGIYQSLAPRRSNNPGSWHPGHIVSVNGKKQIFAAGDVGKKRAYGGAKKKHQTKRRKMNKSRKTRGRK